MNTTTTRDDGVTRCASSLVNCELLQSWRLPRDSATNRCTSNSGKMGIEREGEQVEKGDCRTELEKMTEDREHWHGVASDLTKKLEAARNEIAELLDQLETQRDDAALVGGVNGKGGVLKDLRDQRDDYRRAYKRLEWRYLQLELIMDPQRFVNFDILRKMSDAELAEVEGGRIRSAQAPLTVAYMVVARRFYNDANVTFKQGAGLYFGSVEEFIQETSRFDNIIQRMPMPEDLRGPSLTEYGITEQQRLEAIQALSFYWHDDLLREQFGVQLDTVFKERIEPNLKNTGNAKVQSEQNNLAREALRKTNQETSKNMGKNRMTRIAPTLPSGRHKKQDKIIGFK